MNISEYKCYNNEFEKIIVTSIRKHIMSTLNSYVKIKNNVLDFGGADFESRDA